MLAVITIAPFVINLCGTSVFVYFKVGGKDLIFAASEGVSHNALADHFDFDVIDDQLESIYLDNPSFALQGTSYQLGPLRVWLEPGGGFRPYRFSITPDQGYFAIEFPWLVIPAVLAALGAWRLRVARRRVSP